MSDDPIFGDKEFSGVGYPTPFSIPDETTCLTLKVPASAAWWALIAGLLTYLEADYNWQQFEGGMSRADAAQRWSEMVSEALELAATTNECSAMVEAPYWDDEDADDADDAAPADEQPWYGQLIGEGLTWQEQLSVWIVTAFVAYAATPLAAIQFLPIANKFVLEFRKHNLGGIIRVAINAIETVNIDTYAATPSVGSTTIAIPPSGMGGMGAADTINTLYVSMREDYNPAVTGIPNIQVIRKRLSETEVTPANVRYNADCNCTQQTYDGGETWVDRPDIDPRSSVIYRYPHVVGSDPKCMAAGNMTDFVERWITGVVNSLSLVQMANGILAIITLITPEVGFIIDLIWLVAEALLSIGTTAIGVNFTPEVYDQLSCSLYCVLDDDGQMSDAALTDFLADIDANYSIVVQAVMHEAANLWGAVGFSNAGTVGESTRLCDDCPCVDPCFIPSAETMAQAPCTSAVTNYLRFDSEGAYSVVDAPFGQGAYIWLAGLKPSGIGIGWDVSFSWSGGTPTVYQAASLVRTMGDCVDNPVNLSMTSGLSQFVDADHPYVWIGWSGDGGVFHVTEVCVTRALE